MNWQSQCFSPWALLKWKFNFGSLNSICELSLSLPATPALITFPFYLKVFAFTCLIESPFYFFAAKGRSISSRILQILLLNLATHPIVTWVFPWLFSRFSGNIGNLYMTGECFAFLIEGMILVFVYRYRFAKGFGVSLIANLSSWWLGLLFFGS